MTALTAVLLSAWDIRLEIVLTLGLAAVLHIAGWRRLKKRTNGRFSAGWRPAAFLSGLVVLGLALMSPIDTLSGELFFMHMIQHLLIVAVAAPLLWLADPFPFFMWGLPAGLRKEVGRLLSRDSALRHALRILTNPGLVLLAFISVLLMWHDPQLYGAAQGNSIVHDVEHISYFVTSMAYWWLIIGAAPRIRPRLSRGMRVGMLLAMVPVVDLTGIVIALSTKPIYPYYVNRPRLWGYSVMEDQMLSGIIMWIPGSMMYILGALLLIYKMLGREEEKKPLPEAAWAGDDAMLAPGAKGEK
jgi:cytochrome c oxidase assembly factor CtaG